MQTTETCPRCVCCVRPSTRGSQANPHLQHQPPRSKPPHHRISTAGFPLIIGDHWALLPTADDRTQLLNITVRLTLKCTDWRHKNLTNLSCVGIHPHQQTALLPSLASFSHQQHNANRTATTNSNRDDKQHPTPTSIFSQMAHHVMLPQTARLVTQCTTSCDAASNGRIGHTAHHIM